MSFSSIFGFPPSVWAQIAFQTFHSWSPPSIINFLESVIEAFIQSRLDWRHNCFMIHRLTFWSLQWHNAGKLWSNNEQTRNAPNCSLHNLLCSWKNSCWLLWPRIAGSEHHPAGWRWVHPDSQIKNRFCGKFMGKVSPFEKKRRMSSLVQILPIKLGNATWWFGHFEQQRMSNVEARRTEKTISQVFQFIINFISRSFSPRKLKIFLLPSNLKS